MAFAKKNTDKDAVKAQTSNYINASGIYTVNVLAAFVDTSAAGSSVVNFYVENEGQAQVLYGNMRVTNKNNANGDTVENEIGMKLFNRMLVVADIDEVGDPVEGELPIGKGGDDKVVAILEDLADVEIQIRIQLEYSKYQGKINENKVIREFYRAGDNASAAEIVNDEDNHGTAFDKDQKYVDNITYKDDLTAADIAKWIAGGRESGGAGAADKPKAKTPSFGTKRFNKK